MAKKLPDLTAVLLQGYRSPTKYDDAPLTIIASGWSPDTGNRGVVVRAGRGNYFLAVTDVHGRRVYDSPGLQAKRYSDKDAAKRDLRDYLGVEQLVTESRVLTGRVNRPRVPKPAKGFDNIGPGCVNADQSYDIFISTPDGTYVVQS